MEIEKGGLGPIDILHLFIFFLFFWCARGLELLGFIQVAS